MASSETGGTVSAYRIVSPRWTASAFSGEGAQKYGGRWNSPGRRVVYTAGSRALAALEMLVHLTTPGSRSKPYSIIEVALPIEQIQEIGSAAHPVQAGDDWLKSGSSLALRVPSIIIPEEPNYLINPEHPAFTELRIGKPSPFGFDSRM